jgi:hypothetical protein
VASAIWLVFKGLSFQGILGQVFAPVMYLLGVPWNEAVQAGGLFGTKIVLNEFVAFIDLGALKTCRHRRSPSSPSPCAVCQFQLDRDPDGGDRRPRAQPAPDDRQAGAEGAGGRFALQPDERGAGGVVSVNLSNLMSAALRRDCSFPRWVYIMTNKGF